MLAAILEHYQVDDVAVEDPPLEEVISDLFQQNATTQIVEPVEARV
jgi:ABC-type uncharacterized transport system ATPase subunit